MCLGAGYAASVGGLGVAPIGVWAYGIDECDDSVTVTFTDSPAESFLLEGLDQSCVPGDLSVAFFDAAGNLLAEVSAEMTGSSATLNLSPAISPSDIDSAGAIVGLTSLAVTVVDDSEIEDCLNCTLTITFDSDQPAMYCATATIEGIAGTPSSPVEWQATVDMTSYPLEGTLTGAGNLHSVVEFTHIDGVLTFWGDPSKSDWYSNTWVGKEFTVNWCADRDIPTEGNIWLVSGFNSDWGGGYCAWFEIHTDEPGGVEWTYDIDLAAPPWNGGAEPNSHFGFAYTMDGTVMTASGTGGVWGTQYTFDDEPAAPMGWCASR